MAFTHSAGTAVTNFATELGTGFRNGGLAALQTIEGVGVVSNGLDASAIKSITQQQPLPQLNADLIAITPINSVQSPVVTELNGLIGDVNELGAQLTKQAQESVIPDMDLGLPTTGLQNSIDLSQIQGNIQSPQQLQRKYLQHAARVKAEVMAEIRRCIEQHLRKILGENPLIRAIIDPEGMIADIIAKLRKKLRLKIQIARRKSQVKRQQRKEVKSLRTNIFKGVKKICPEASPTALARYQNDSKYLEAAVQRTTNQIMGGIEGMVNKVPL